MPGTLPFKADCLKCPTLARLVRLFDLRRCVQVRPMTTEEFERVMMPFFIPDEIGRTPEERYAREEFWVRGLDNVTRRVFREIFMPKFWKERNFRMKRVVVPPGSWTPHTDTSIAEAVKALDGMKGEVRILEGTYPVTEPIDLSPDILITGVKGPVLFGTPWLQGPVFRGQITRGNVSGVVFEGRGAPEKSG